MKAKADLRDVMDVLLHTVVPLAVVRDGKIVYANDACYHALGYDPAQSAVGQDCLRFLHPAEQDQAREQLEQLTDEQRNAVSVPRLLLDARGATVRAVGALTPVQWDDAPAIAITFMIVLQEEDDASKPPPSSRRVPPSVDLGTLSPRERQVALLVAQGFGVQNIAALLRIRRETVRTHIKAVYRKTRTHTRVELTRLMLGLPGPSDRIVPPVTSRERPRTRSL